MVRSRAIVLYLLYYLKSLLILKALFKTHTFTILNIGTFYHFTYISHPSGDNRTQRRDTLLVQEYLLKWYV